jgi:hypothetical protein
MKTQILDQTQSMGQKKTDKCKWQRIKGERVCGWKVLPQLAIFCGGKILPKSGTCCFKVRASEKGRESLYGTGRRKGTGFSHLDVQESFLLSPASI